MEVVDDLSTGSIENISHLKGHPHFAYTLDSVMNRSLMLELVDRADVIFHLAAAVALRAGLRGRVRGHGAPGAGYLEDPGADRVPASAGSAGDVGASDCARKRAEKLRRRT